MKIRLSLSQWNPTCQLRAAGSILDIKPELRWDKDHVQAPHTPASFTACQALVPESWKHMSHSKCVSSPLLWIRLLTLWSTFLNGSLSMWLKSREKSF